MSDYSVTTEANLSPVTAEPDGRIVSSPPSQGVGERASSDTDLFAKCDSFVEAEQAKAIGYYPFFKKVSSAEEPEAIVEGRKVVMLGSNNYLGLTTDPRVQEAAIAAVTKYGTSTCGSRFLNGSLDLHYQLEERMARFLNRESALVFTTGYQTNLGTVSALVGKGDVVISDKWNHASIVDGARLSFGELKRFRHNDMTHLERILASSPKDAGKLIVVDGVFSMEGDLAPLPNIVELANWYGARVMVDDAHGIGVMGEHGRGTAEHQDVEDQIDLVMGTFSKAFGSLGGVIAGDERVISYVQHQARSMIFSASLSPSAVATVLAALDIVETEPERRNRLWANSRKLAKGLQDLGFDTGCTKTPVIPVVIGDLFKALGVWKSLLEGGVYVNLVMPPAVPQNRVLLRTSCIATHTEQQLDFVLDVFERVGRQHDLI